MEEKGGCLSGVYGIGVIAIFTMSYFSWENPFWESLWIAVIWPFFVAKALFEAWRDGYFQIPNRG